MTTIGDKLPAGFRIDTEWVGDTHLGKSANLFALGREFREGDRVIIHNPDNAARYIAVGSPSEVRLLPALDVGTLGVVENRWEEGAVWYTVKVDHGGWYRLRAEEMSPYEDGP